MTCLPFGQSRQALLEPKQPLRKPPALNPSIFQSPVLFSPPKQTSAPEEFCAQNSQLSSLAPFPSFRSSRGTQKNEKTQSLGIPNMRLLLSWAPKPWRGVSTLRAAHDATLGARRGALRRSGWSVTGPCLAHLGPRSKI